jgi:hypothetical protein
MTTQIRPLAGGAWNSVSLSTNKIVKKDTVFGLTASPGNTHAVYRALNQWVNCGGTGPHATAAQKIAKAASLQIQEV